MNILAFDTSSTACSVALLVENDISQSHKIAPMQQSQLILPMIDEMMISKNIQLKQLDAIAFGCGPGSFTGIRIATSIAQGLGYALNIPLIPISSLAALAQTAFNELGWENLLVAIDARIQEIYWGHYCVNSKGLAELQGSEGMGAPETVSQNYPDTLYGVGSAWKIYADQLLFQPLKTDVELLPTASSIIQLAIPRFRQQEWSTADKVLPVYLRDEVATKEKKR